MNGSDFLNRDDHLDTLRSAVDGAVEVAIIACDGDGMIALFSRGAERMLGYAADEVVGRVAVNSFHLPEEIASRAEELSRAYGERVRGNQVFTLPAIRGDVYPREWTLVHKDGTHVAVELVVTPRRDTRGTVRGFVRVALDIGRRKQMEHALERERAFAARLINQAPVIVLLLNRDGTIDFVNPYFEDLTGYKAEEVCGEDWFSLFIPEHVRGDIRELFQRALTGTPTRGQVHPILTRTGALIDVQWHDQLMPNRDGGAAGLLATGQDVTAQRQAELALRQSEARLRQAQHIAKIGNWELDLRTNQLYWSDEIYRIFEVDRAESPASYDAFLDAIHPDDRDAVNDAYMRSLRDGAPYKITHRLRMPDGRIKYVEEQCETEFGADGTPLISRGTVQDVTETKALEDELIQARKMEAVGQLAGGIAHDFNNLLQVIGGNTELALATVAKDSESYEAIQEIADATERATSLVRQLLAFSRRQAMEPVPIDLTEITGNVMRLLRRIIGEDIELAAPAPAEPVHIQADPGMMEQVIFNLCINARDAMPDGGRLRIEIGKVDVEEATAQNHDGIVPGPFAYLRVADTGVGMDHVVLERAFEPFFTTKEAGKGTGMGLATVYGIVRQHCGFITIESEPGVGTCMNVHLPHYAGRIPAGRACVADVVPGGQETILLAEDDPQVRRLAVRSLEQAGYTVLEAVDGRHAIERFHATCDAIHLALLDVVMPKMGGRETCHAIRALRPGLPVVFSTGYDDDRLCGDVMREGDTYVLRKPYSEAGLLGAVRRALDRAAAGSSAE